MNKLPLACAVTLALLGALPAAAQSPHGGHAATSPASEAYMKSMTGMAAAMKATAMTGDVDKDFILMMKPHHQAAVAMAETYLKYGNDPLLTRMAKDIVASQNDEIAAMDRWMTEKGAR